MGNGRHRSRTAQRNLEPSAALPSLPAICPYRPTGDGLSTYPGRAAAPRLHHPRPPALDALDALDAVCWCSCSKLAYPFGYSGHCRPGNPGPTGRELQAPGFQQLSPQLWTDFDILGVRYDIDMNIAPLAPVHQHMHLRHVLVSSLLRRRPRRVGRLGVGIISSAALWSDCLNETDWRLSGNHFGSQPFPSADGMRTIQPNIFGQGRSWGGAPPGLKAISDQIPGKNTYGVFGTPPSPLSPYPQQRHPRPWPRNPAPPLCLRAATRPTRGCSDGRAQLRLQWRLLDGGHDLLAACRRHLVSHIPAPLPLVVQNGILGISSPLLPQYTDSPAGHQPRRGRPDVRRRHDARVEHPDQRPDRME